MSYEMITILMFSAMLLMRFTDRQVFDTIGAVAAIATVTLWGTVGSDIVFSSAMNLMNWHPLLTLPMFIFMGYILSESKINDDLNRKPVFTFPTAGRFRAQFDVVPASRPWEDIGIAVQTVEDPEVVGTEHVFWDEFTTASETKARVVDIFKKYNVDMVNTGRPYCCG